MNRLQMRVGHCEGFVTLTLLEDGQPGAPAEIEPDAAFQLAAALIHAGFKAQEYKETA